jgi:cell division septum initiation protein DivIVA
MNGTEPVRSLLDKIAAREQAIAAEAEQVRARLDELTARLRELEQEAEHLRITRKTVLALADESDPQPAVTQHPAYQQILAAFAEARNPLRARDLCQALDLDIIAKNIESTRHKLERLVSRGILTESEPGLFTLLRT